MGSKAFARILVVEDDASLAQVVAEVLSKEGFSVKICADGRAGLAEALSGGYDLVILDVMLPGMDGFSVCKRMRENGIYSCVLMLTVRDGVKDKVEGFESGADDYLTKPFEVEELVARVKALLRRSRNYRSIMRLGNLEIDAVRRKVFLNGEVVELSPKEFEILELLARNRGKVLGERAILKSVWGSADLKGGILKVYIHHLRQKLKDGDGRLIRTIRGVGYMLDVP